MMSIAGVIGGSLFVGSGSIVHSAGPAAVLAYLAGGIVVVFIMRMLGEMATANPDTGSFSTYADRAIGRWAGFTIGWLYWGYWALLMAWEAHVAGIILHEWFPMLSVNAFTLGATLVLILLNFFNVRNYGEAEFWFALIKVVAIVCFIVVGTLAVLGCGPGARPRAWPTRWRMAASCPTAARRWWWRCWGDVRLPGRGDRHHRRVRVSQSGAADQPRHALGGVAGLPVLHRLDLPDRRAGAVE